MIIYSQKFHQSIEELVEILFVKQYFSFIDDCQVYVSKIYDFIDDNISKPINKDTPIPLIMFGEKYIRYKQIIKPSGIYFLIKREITL